MLEKGLIKMETEKKGEKAKKKKHGNRQNLCYESNKNICENNSNPLDLHTSLNSGPYAFWRFSVSL